MSDTVESERNVTNQSIEYHGSDHNITIEDNRESIMKVNTIIINTNSNSDNTNTYNLLISSLL